MLGLTYDLIIFADAVIATKKNKTVEQKSYDKWYVYLLIILTMGMGFEFVYQPAKNKLGIVQFANSPTVAMDELFPFDPDLE